MTRYATSPSRSEQQAILTRLPSEILRNIFRSLFEEVIIDLKKPHDLGPRKLIESFPILAVDKRLLSEGVHVLLHHATFEIEDLTNFPREGTPLKMLQRIRNLALQKYQLATFGLSRQFPRNALRSSRKSFENLQKIDISVWSSVAEKDMILLPGCLQVPLLVQFAWDRPAGTEEFDLCYDYRGTTLTEFIKEFQRKYTLVLRIEFWIGGHLVSQFPLTSCQYLQQEHLTKNISDAKRPCQEES